MSDRERKQTALQELAQLDAIVLERLVELIRNKKYKSVLSNSLQFTLFKGALKKHI